MMLSASTKGSSSFSLSSSSEIFGLGTSAEMMSPTEKVFECCFRDNLTLFSLLVCWAVIFWSEGAASGGSKMLRIFACLVCTLLRILRGDGAKVKDERPLSPFCGQRTVKSACVMGGIVAALLSLGLPCSPLGSGDWFVAEVKGCTRGAKVISFRPTSSTEDTTFPSRTGRSSCNCR